MKTIEKLDIGDLKWFFLHSLIWLGVMILVEILAALAGGYLNLGLALLASFLIFLEYVAAVSLYQHYRNKKSESLDRE